MNGPPLSPAHPCTNGACRLLRSFPQISERMIAPGYALVQAAGEITDMWPVLRNFGSASALWRVSP
jgi:hypothetical protein